MKRVRLQLLLVCFLSLASCSTLEDLAEQTGTLRLKQDVPEVTYTKWTAEQGAIEETGTLKEGWFVVPFPPEKK